MREVHAVEKLIGDVEFKFIPLTMSPWQQAFAKLSSILGGIQGDVDKTGIGKMFEDGEKNLGVLQTCTNIFAKSTQIKGKHGQFEPFTTIEIQFQGKSDDYADWLVEHIKLNFGPLVGKLRSGVLAKVSG